RVNVGVPLSQRLGKYWPFRPLPPVGGGTGADASSLPICCRYALTAFTSAVFSVMFVCARTASASVAAEPSCRYGAVAHTSRSVGTSMPLSGPARRCPLLGLVGPVLLGLLLPLLVNAVPPWHEAQLRLVNTVRPSLASALSAPLAGRA